MGVVDDRLRHDKIFFTFKNHLDYTFIISFYQPLIFFCLVLLKISGRLSLCLVFCAVRTRPV